MSGKSQKILKWMISGNPGQFLPILPLDGPWSGFINFHSRKGFSDSILEVDNFSQLIRRV